MARPEGKTLSSIDTLENTPSPETDEAAQAHDGHDREHDHGHEHQHGPVLNPECTRELILDIPAGDVSKAFSRVVGVYKNRARIPGFRPGKVPETVIRRRFATEIRKEVIDSLLPERFNQGVRDMGVKPVGQPQVTELTVEDGQPLHVKAVFEYVPDFSIEGYQSVTVEKPSVEVTDEEFQRELAELRESRATIEPVEEDRALVDGDWAEISYHGLVANAPDTAPLTGEDALVEIGGKETVEAFTAVLRGAKSGQELKAEVIYPAEYPDAKLAGKTVAYDVTERYTFPVPESLVQDQIDARLERGLRALAAQGMDTEQMRKLDFARLRTAQRDSAIAEVKTFALLERIADAENITVSDEEMDHELQLAALQSREPVDTLRARLTQDGGLGRIREQLRREKTASLLYERLPA